MSMQSEKSEATSTGQVEKEKKYSPINYKPCQICGGKATGYHFGVISCEACKSFFRRSLKRKNDPICDKGGGCPVRVNEVTGIPCPACRLQRCQEEGMSEKAVKKGRYSLDRRAETILEARKYWNKEDSTGPIDIKPEIDTYSDIGTALFGPRTGNNTSYYGGTDVPERTVNTEYPPIHSASEQAVSSSNAVSNEELYRLFNAACGNGSGAGGCDSTQSQSFTSLLEAAENLNHSQLHVVPTSVPSDPQPEIPGNNLYMNIAPLEYLDQQVQTNLSPTHIQNDNSVSCTQMPTDIVNSAIVPTEYKTKGNEMVDVLVTANEGYPPPHHMQQRNNTVMGNDSQVGYSATNLSAVGEESVGMQTKVAMSPPVQTVKPMVNDMAALKHKNEDMDLLCQMLLSDIKVKDEQDYLIDEIVSAFDKQNFTNKGFLSKISDLQQRYLETRREEEKMFGRINRLSSEEFIKMYKETGVDIDGRLKIMQEHADVMDDWIKKVMCFYKGIPGFQDLPIKDQQALIKGTRFLFKQSTYFPCKNAKAGLVVSFLVPEIVIDAEMIASFFPSKAKRSSSCLLGNTAERLQDLQITDREYAMLTAVFVIDPDYCITDDGKRKCRELSERLEAAFIHLLRKRLSSDKTGDIMAQIMDIRSLLKPLANDYNIENYRMMEMYTEHCGVKYGALTWQYHQMYKSVYLSSSTASSHFPKNY